MSTLIARPDRDELCTQDLARRYVAVRKATDWLCEPIGPEDSTVQSMPDASPAKWHQAHTTWFFETMVLEAETPDFRPMMPEFRVLFNSYYNSIGEQYPRPERGLITRPTLDEVRAYRAHVDEKMLDLISSGDGPAPRVAAVIEVGLHHEQQHQELILMDFKHLLSRNPLAPAYRDAVEVTSGKPARVGWRSYAAGRYEIGHQGLAGPGFCYDNETPRHPVVVGHFEIGTRPVTNGEFLAFIADRGYQRPELWLADGWDTVCRERWTAPLYWERSDDAAWHARTLAGRQALREDEPVCHVSFYEAEAYARWNGARLPTEAEWEVAFHDAPIEGNFVEEGLFHPGIAQSTPYGDVWEFTQSPYTPYPGYRPPEGALGEYNGKFMVNQVVLRGGCCATPRSHIRPTYRNFFYPQMRWQFGGIRLARDVG